MSHFRVYCESCETEYHVTPTSEDFKDPPQACCFCGANLETTNVADEADDYDEEDRWDKLVDEALDDIDDWKDDEV